MLTLELMKTHVVKVYETSTIREAVDLMDIYQVDSLPVVDTEDRLTGMISEGDILKALATRNCSKTVVCEQNQFIAESAVATYMVPNVISISERCEAAEAVSLILDSGLKRIPVVTEDKHVVGTLNRVDVFQALFDDLKL